jgi:hypothetical protein
MNHSPVTQLIKKNVLDIIRLYPTEYLGPNQDIMSIIGDDIYIDPIISIDDYWMKLGCECCNLRRWSMYSSSLLEHCFGKSSKYVKYINKYSNLLGLIKHIMDVIVCRHYVSSQHDIECNGKQINIIKLFYGNETITEYPVKYSAEYKNQFKEFKHTLTSQDKQYILTFVDRTKSLIEYLENKFDLYNHNTQTKQKEKQKLFTVINKFNKLFETENIINDIAVKERP